MMAPLTDRIRKIISPTARVKASLGIVNPETVRAILELRAEKSPQSYYLKLTQILAQLVNAELCLAMIPPRVGAHFIVLIGYNHLAQKVIDGFTIDGRKMPELLQAIKKGESRRFDADKANAEVLLLTQELGLTRPAHLLAVPFSLKEPSPQMGFLLLSNPAEQSWSEADANWLLEIIQVLVTGIPQPEDKTEQVSTPDEMEKLQQEYSQLKTQYAALSAQVKDGQQSRINDPEFEKRVNDLQQKVQQLETRNQELENLVAKYRPSNDEAEQLRQELRSALADLARIPTTLSKSDQKMLELQLSAVKQLDDMGQSELIASMAQDFRQPLSSISGYTDLLLTESVGILGALQRQFLERIRASVERMGTLINELVQIAAIKDGNLDQTRTYLDIKAEVSEAIDNIHAQVSEKNILLNVNLPEDFPPLQANKDAIQQILANLLQNACLVTPANDEIILSAQLEAQENEIHYLLIEVTDHGGGVSKADIPRIFSRQYKAQNPVIKGIGDTGVGLSIVKSLVELQKGRIWIEAQEGIGTTFSCIIPVQADIDH